ncbi:DUF6069 family protein [Actinomadura sp. RB99]|uniref:DUF6069 family protein n=1 Tax=Actinomadura sp. RB99 TaxID=2691577 RepID=UPI00240F5267|nr:DUF6069 family protein [Actinomadura sp. RB99]
MASSPFVARVRGRRGAGRNALEAHDGRHHHSRRRFRQLADRQRPDRGGRRRRGDRGQRRGGQGRRDQPGRRRRADPGGRVRHPDRHLLRARPGARPGLALVLAPWARRPRPVFVRTTLVLTALSLAPDVLADASAATKALLMLTYLAAEIVIPAVARRRAA